MKKLVLAIAVVLATAFVTTNASENISLNLCAVTTDWGRNIEKKANEATKKHREEKANKEREKYKKEKEKREKESKSDKKEKK